MIVWVMQENPSINYQPAEKWGDEIRFITTAELRSYDCPSNKIFDIEFKDFLSKYIVGRDYIVPTGNPMVMIRMAMDLPPGEHKFLKWNVHGQEYTLFRMVKK